MCTGVQYRCTLQGRDSARPPQTRVGALGDRGAAGATAERGKLGTETYETCRPGDQADAGLWAEEVDIQCHDKSDATDDVNPSDQTQPHLVTS